MSRVGEILDGKYELVRLLGQGGMGEVYVARHKLIGKDVAIKFLRKDLTSDEDALARFAQEARAAAAVGHRGIVDIYDIGTSPDAAPYLVMELLDGDSLRAVLAHQRKLPVATAAAIMSELLSALVAAHAKGIVHRDLKPDNVFVERTDGPLSIKLLDFGIAKMTEGAEVRITRTGFPLGTAQYMSPEQARGERDLDARVDVWSVGVMLYESLTGRLPFDADNYNALIVQILREDIPSPRTAEPSLSAEIEAVVMKAMAKERDQRYATAAELLAALRPFVHDVDARSLTAVRTPVVIPSPSAQPPSSPMAATIPAAEVPVTGGIRTPFGTLVSPRRPLRTVAAAGLLALAVAVAWTLTSAGPDRREARDDPRPTPAQRRSADAGRPARAPGPTTVTLRLEGVPEGARVYFDGALVPELPIRVAPREGMVPLRVEAEGFQASSQMVLPDRDRTIHVSLVAEAPTKTTERPRHPHGPPSKVVPPAGSQVTKIQRDTREFDQ